MLKIKTLIYIIFLFTLSPTLAQDSITINKCIVKYFENSLLNPEKSTIKQGADLKRNNIRANYLPKNSINAQYTTQSEVISIDMDIPIPGFEAPQGIKNQYKAYVELTQLIYDGGKTKKMLMFEEQNMLSSINELDVKIYAGLQKVYDLYFAVLLLDKQLKLTEIAEKELNNRHETILAGVKNGVLLQANADIIESEILKLKQQHIELSYTKKAAIEALKELCGIDQEINGLEIPFIKKTENVNQQRPEYKLFENNKTKLNALSSLAGTSRMPTLAAFGQFGYGRPGLNMLDENAQEYYIVGLKASWTIFDWNTTRRNKQMYSLMQSSIDVQQKSFDQKNRIELIQLKAKQNYLKQQIEIDKSIISKRKNITWAYRSKLDNGIINSTEYLTVFNAETQASLSLEIHQLSLLKTQAIINYILGNEL